MYCVPVRTRASRNGDRVITGVRESADVFRIWPRRRSTSAALVGLILIQAMLFFAVTRRSFFFADDYNYFKLAEQRSVFRYLLTPVLGVYPAPGDRLASLLLNRLFPLNFTVARAILIAFLAGTTILLRQFVATLARSTEWWTVAILTPFALSLTLVLPLSWWSAGLPIIPATFFTVVAFSAWLRFYEDPTRWFWLAVTVTAVAAAGAFYIDFLLIPIYLLFFRLAIFPRLLDLPGGIRVLWRERVRWIAVAAPPAAFVAVFVLSGLAGRSAAGGSRPYVDYFATAWFRAFIPVSFLNARLVGSGPSIPSWVVVVLAQVIFVGVIVATWRRSSLAVRGWALFLFAFALNVAVVGTVRLPGFGAKIAYDLRYYPEVTLFLPLALALGLRQGEERRPALAWERGRIGRTAIALAASLYVVSFLIWAPGIVSDSPGVPTRSWYDNLRHDMGSVIVHDATPRIVDSETPDYVMPDWMAPDNRVSTILALAGLDVVFDELSEPIYLVRDDGHLAKAEFQPISPLQSGTTPGEGVHIVGGAPVRSLGICLGDGGSLQYRLSPDVTGGRLGIRVFYSGEGRQSVAMQVDTGDPDSPFRYLELRPFQGDAELVDLETSRLRALTLDVSPGDRVCIERMEVGSLIAGA